MSFAKDSTSIPKPPPRWWWRWGRRLLLGLLGCALVAALTYAHYRHRWAEELRAAMADVDRTDPSWRLTDLEAARAVVLDDENSALIVQAAFQALPADWSAPDTFSNLPPQMELDDGNVAWLRDHLSEWHYAVRKARTLAERPNGRYPFIDQRCPNPDFHDIQHIRPVLTLLQLDIRLQTQIGDLNGALRSCRALLNGARSLGDEPILVGQLVRVAGVGITCHAAERVLAQGEPNADDLLRLQRALEDEERFPRLVVSLRGERAVVHERLLAIEAGELAVADFGEIQPTEMDRRVEFVQRYLLRSLHPQWLAQITEAIQIAALPAHERVAPMAAFDARLKASTSGLAAVIAPRWVTIYDQAARRTDGILRCAITAIAAERYRRQNGHWPDELAQLVPEFLPAVPLDPQNGEPLGYQRLPGRVVLYSLCPIAGKQAYDPQDPSPPGFGVAFHLFDVKERRQPFVEILPPPTPDDDDLP